MAGSALIAVKLGRDATIYDETVSMLQSLRLPVKMAANISTDDIMNAMMHDKKFREGHMLFIIPDAIGTVSIVKDIPVQLIRETIDQLREGEEAHV
ncbi:3-dehydroquinate synthase [compost metagenome]